MFFDLRMGVKRGTVIWYLPALFDWSIIGCTILRLALINLKGEKNVINLCNDLMKTSWKFSTLRKLSFQFEKKKKVFLVSLVFLSLGFLFSSSIGPTRSSIKKSHKSSCFSRKIEANDSPGRRWLAENHIYNALTHIFHESFMRWNWKKFFSLYSTYPKQIFSFSFSLWIIYAIVYTIFIVRFRRFSSFFG